MSTPLDGMGGCNFSDRLYHRVNLCSGRQCSHTQAQCSTVLICSDLFVNQWGTVKSSASLNPVVGVQQHCEFLGIVAVDLQADDSGAVLDVLRSVDPEPLDFAKTLP